MPGAHWVPTRAGAAAALAVPDHHHLQPEDHPRQGPPPGHGRGDRSIRSPTPTGCWTSSLTTATRPGSPNAARRRAGVHHRAAAAAGRQRAALILRDVLAWNAAETAALLDISVPAANSALQRARATLAAGSPAAAAYPPLGSRERDLVDRFTDAWRRCDIDALAALLREDVILSMPPELIRITGRAQVARFFATVPAGAGSTLSAWPVPAPTASRRWPPISRISPRDARATESWSSPPRRTASPPSQGSPARTSSGSSDCPSPVTEHDGLNQRLSLSA